VVREALEASIRYYGRLGRLALEGGALLVRPVFEERTITPAQPPAQPAARRATAPPARRSQRTVLLEAPAGKSALGVFVVENVSADPVATELAVSPLAGPSGEQAESALRFVPERIALEPGDQVLVQVAAPIDASLEPGVRYRGEISIPGLSGVRVPIALRRRPDEGEG
jgi:hypothetical protein